MKKLFAFLIVALLLNFGLVSAITEQEINEAKTLVDSGADCKSLSDSQLELIGEYYMEQMHPGEAHELMHKMMGFEEGSDAEKQFHINLAKTIYCNERGTFVMLGGGMMGSMMQGIASNNFLIPYYFDYTIFWTIIALLVISIVLNAYLVFKIKGAKK